MGVFYKGLGMVLDPKKTGIGETGMPPQASRNPSFLFTETGFRPIKLRRVTLQLSYLLYLLALHGFQLARATLTIQLRLAFTGK